MHIAVQNGHVKIINNLLQCNSNVNSHTTDDGSFPLFKAALKGNSNVIQVLLIHGADLNAKTTEGWTALKAAAQEGNSEIVRIHLNNEADINAPKVDLTFLTADRKLRKSNISSQSCLSS